MKYFILILSLGLCSCSVVAKLSELPRSSKEINFSSYAGKDLEISKDDWTYKEGDEYYFTARGINKKTLISAITNSLKILGYKIEKLDMNENCITSSRNIQITEWKSIYGVYFNNIDNESYEIYIINRITQDRSGGRNIYRSKKLAKFINLHLDKFTKRVKSLQGYPSDTNTKNSNIFIVRDNNFVTNTTIPQIIFDKDNLGYLRHKTFIKHIVSPGTYTIKLDIKGETKLRKEYSFEKAKDYFLEVSLETLTSEFDYVTFNTIKTQYNYITLLEPMTKIKFVSLKESGLKDPSIKRKWKGKKAK